MQYDPLQPDAYAEHLGEVNNAKQVTISEDIINAKGVLIAKKGQQVSAETVNRIVQFKLLKPLEESIEIAGTLTGDKLLGDIRAAMDGSADEALHRRYEMDAEIERGVKYLSRFPILRQKLTVLAMQMPNEYRKSLLVAWYALMIGQKLNLSPFERDQAFVAALLHDAGMLHIDRKLIDKKESLTAEEWRTMQGHVAIGHLILSRTDGIGSAVPIAVLEHHEVADGTGYLSGKRGHQLSRMGQLIGVVDAMCAVLLKLRTQGRSSRDLLTVLRVNSYVYSYDVCAAFIQLLAEQQLPAKRLIGDENIADFVATVLSSRDAISAYTDAVQKLLDDLPPEAGHRMSVQAARVVFDHLTNILRASGVLDPGYASWLRTVVAEHQQSHYRDIEDTRLMLDEVRWQSLKLKRLLHGIENDKNAMTVVEHNLFCDGLRALPPLN